MLLFLIRESPAIILASFIALSPSAGKSSVGKLWHGKRRMMVIGPCDLLTWLLLGENTRDPELTIGK